MQNTDKDTLCHDAHVGSLEVRHRKVLLKFFAEVKEGVEAIRYQDVLQMDAMNEWVIGWMWTFVSSPAVVFMAPIRIFVQSRKSSSCCVVHCWVGELCSHSQYIQKGVCECMWGPLHVSTFLIIVKVTWRATPPYYIPCDSLHRSFLTARPVSN